jgi:flavoprotein
LLFFIVPATNNVVGQNVNAVADMLAQNVNAVADMLALGLDVELTRAS